MTSHRPKYISLIVILFTLLAAGWVQAQDTTPPAPTPIPILPATTQESAAPGLGNSGAPALQAATPFPETTAAAEVTEAAESAGLNLPDTPVCPALVQESFTAMEQVCTGVAPGEGCIGNGTVETIFAANVSGINFSAPGDRVRLNSIRELNVRTSNTPGAVWSVVSGRLELNSTDGDVPVSATVLIFGDVTLIDTGEVSSGSAVRGTVLAQFGMNVRREPNANGVVVWQLNPGEQITVTGRTPDREWLRMVIPSQFSGVGWVYAPYIEVEGGVDALPFVTEASPAPQLTAPDFGPMQSFEMLSAITPAECDSTIPDSGLLLQTPNGLPDNVRLRVNGTLIEVNGTIFLQGISDALQILVLEGQAAVTGTGDAVTVSAGNVAFVPMNADLQPAATTVVTAFDLTSADTLPLRLLPRIFVLNAAPVSEPAASTDTGTPAAPAAVSCVLTIPNEVRNLRTGPGLEYPVQRVVQPNESLTGAGQAAGSLGYIWYQTNEGGWIRMDAAAPSEGCSSLPAVAAPPIPEPTAVPTIDPATRSLNSSVLGAVTCPAGQVSTSTPFDGSEFSVALGGTWTATAGTTVVFSTQGGQLRPEFGDYIQLIAEDGSVIAGSGEGRELRLTFDQNRTFTARFSAGNGDLVIIAARCEN